MNINKIRKAFPIYKHNSGLVYLDSAASALKLNSIIESENYYYKNLGANIHRGVYKLSYLTTEKYENSRGIIAQYLNAFPDEVIFTKGTTDSLNMVAKMIEPLIEEGSEIITSELEHHSSLLPWMMVAENKRAKLKYIPLTKDGKITVANFKKVLSEKTKVIAITHMSNVLGDLVPAKEIFELIRDKKIYRILDCAQSVTRVKIDVKDLDADFLAFSGHKMFGPTGIGILYGKKELLNALPKPEFGGEMVNQVFMDHATFKDAPLGFEAGTQNIAGAIALSEAVNFLSDICAENISAHANKLRNYALKKLLLIDGLTIYNKKSAGPIIAFNVDGIHPHDSATYLDQEGICVRAGHHCAQLLNNFFGVSATVRASFSIYNNKKDCDLFIEAVKNTVDFFKKFQE